MMLRTFFCAAASSIALAAAGAAAQETGAKKPERWNAPFGGSFNAYFTVVSDYSYAGISNTQLQPAVQVSLDYRTPDLLSDLPLWFYATVFGSNVSFPASGPGEEIDLAGGFKVRLLDRRLKLDLGYIRYLYPSTPAVLAYEYGEIHFQADYDFGPFNLSARIHHSPNFFGNSGRSWTKRLRLGVPLDFLPFNDKLPLQAYGTLGNLWVENFLNDSLPSQDYWFWQIGLTTTVYGLDLHVAYTDTSISYEGCLYTNYCAGRIIAGVTKAF